jgi:hypothetical protein
MRIMLISTMAFSREMLSNLVAISGGVVGVGAAKTAAQNSDYLELKSLFDELGVLRFTAPPTSIARLR